MLQSVISIQQLEGIGSQESKHPKAARPKVKSAFDSSHTQLSAISINMDYSLCDAFEASGEVAADECAFDSIASLFDPNAAIRVVLLKKMGV